MNGMFAVLWLFGWTLVGQLKKYWMDIKNLLSKSSNLGMTLGISMAVNIPLLLLLADSKVEGPFHNQEKLHILQYVLLV